MNFVTDYIRLDVGKPGSQARIYVKDGDTNSRQIVAHLYHNGKPYELDENARVVLRATKPDGTVVFDSCKVVGNTIQHVLSSQTIAVTGDIACEFTVYGTDNDVLFSPFFDISVSETLYSDDEVESTNEFTALTHAMSDLNALEQNVAEAEAVRNENEQKRVELYEELKDIYDDGIPEHNHDDKYLSKQNTEEYTPTSDYHPATRKFVVDALQRVNEGGSAYILPVATKSTLGGVKVGSGLSVTQDGTLSANATEQYVLPKATASTLGGVKVGSGLSVTSDGTLKANVTSQYTLPTASASTLGGVKVGSGLSVTSDGTLKANVTSQYTLPPATASTLGGVKVGSGLSVTSDGTISAPTNYAPKEHTHVIKDITDFNPDDFADKDHTHPTVTYTAVLPITGWSTQAPYTCTITVQGVTTESILLFSSELSDDPSTRKNELSALSCITKADPGNNLVTITCDERKPETPVTLNIVDLGKKSTQSGDNGGTSSGYVLPIASASVLGGVKIGSGLSIDANGVLSSTGGNAYVLPVASASALGGVKIGSGVTVASDGTISVSTNYAPKEHTHSQYAALSGAAFTGQVSGVSPTGNTGAFRNIHIASGEPSSSLGSNGDICIVLGG